MYVRTYVRTLRSKFKKSNIEKKIRRARDGRTLEACSLFLVHVLWLLYSWIYSTDPVTLGSKSSCVF